MQREEIIERLQQDGLRITKQREILIDIILNNECSSCKEIYYKAVKDCPNMGMATVYRVIHILEKIGAISRKNMYQVDTANKALYESKNTIVLEDQSAIKLSMEEWNRVVTVGLRACGYAKKRVKIRI